MRYVAAALLSAFSGTKVDENSIKKILDSVGIECDAEKAKVVVGQLKGKDLEELLAEGMTKLASMPAGGGAAPAAAAAAAGGGAAPGAAEKKEEKKEEPEEESDDDMGFGLFD